jgi:hypothetical protein
MSRAGISRRLRMSSALTSRLESKLVELHRKDDLSPFVEEICELYLEGDLVRISKDTRESLEKLRSKMMRREDLGPFIEWICLMFLEQQTNPQQSIDVHAVKVRRHGTSEQRKTA